MSDTKLCEFIVIKSGRPMSEKEVVQVMRRSFGRKVNRAGTPLLRACKISTSTGKYLPDKDKALIVRDKDENGKTVFSARPEVTAWMIPEQ